MSDKQYVPEAPDSEVYDRDRQDMPHGPLYDPFKNTHK